MGSDDYVMLLYVDRFFVVALLLQEIAKCNTSAQKLMLSLVLRSSNWDEIIAKKQSRAVQKLAKFFNIPKVGVWRNSRFAA